MGGGTYGIHREGGSELSLGVEPEGAELLRIMTAGRGVCSEQQRRSRRERKKYIKTLEPRPEKCRRDSSGTEISNIQYSLP